MSQKSNAMTEPHQQQAKSLDHQVSLKFVAIAAVANQNALGKEGSIPWHAPNDLKFFKNITQNKILIMGRKTFESLPYVFKNRHSIIVTSDVKKFWESAKVIQLFSGLNQNQISELVSVESSVEKAIQRAQAVCSARLYSQAPLSQFIIVAGGGQIYKQLLPVTDALIVTQVGLDVSGADTFFVEIDPAHYQLAFEQALQKTPLPLTVQFWKKLDPKGLASHTSAPDFSDDLLNQIKQACPIL